MSTKPERKKFNPKMLAYLGFLSVVTVFLSFKKISDTREKERTAPTVEDMEAAIRKGSEESRKRLAEYDSIVAAHAKKTALKVKEPAVEKK